MSDATVEYQAAAPKRQNGRTPPPLPTVTLPDSGYMVEFRSVGPLALQTLSREVRKSIPGPVPPLNEVTGLDGKKHQEANRTDPEYLQAMQLYEATVNEVLSDRIVSLIAQVVTTPIDLDAVQRAREDFEAIGVSLEGRDREIFLRHVLVASDRDLAALRDAVLRRSQPTEEAVQEKVEEFRGDVQGS